MRRLRISLVFNLLILFLTIVASIIMFTGFKFMNGPETTLESTKLGMLRFFTVESNMFMGISSLIFSITELQLLNKKINEIPIQAYIIKLMSTASVALTFLVVFTYLGPITEYGLPAMLMNSNLFFHLIIPVLSIFTFIVFERTDKLNLKHTIYGILPTILYALYYLINVLIHMENGRVSPKYDWYWFVQNGVWTAVIVAPMILLITYFISLILWRCNKKTSA
ncbi:MAG: hypothetical protein IKG56_01695 [Clostridia bacterium]|nr:hypothetical protein [Clostridia bacterium]